MTGMAVTALVTTVAPSLGMHNASRTRRGLGHIGCVVTRGVAEAPAPLGLWVAADCVVVGSDRGVTHPEPSVRGKPRAACVTWWR
ncbi:hypothetical protein GUJ93_ZPchr0010g8981 [Zizania palustris]|uniref:Uncharacterized protein n=1 Tax=Zizania palustris TaxID=103762 RepID=A0A8J6BJT8_ZIZPA|nr:hypothetical protein GUJ93_ZPchr0010g8981 [Zizania palustris]